VQQMGKEMLVQRSLHLIRMFLIFLLPLFMVACATTVCKVEKVEWIGVPRNDGKTNLEVGANPANRGGGDRIFPDQNHPSGNLHDRVLVRATLSQPPPPNQAVVVHFKLFDEDHYSADPDFDPNGVSAGDDNVKAGEPLTMDIGAKLMKADFSAEATSVILFHDVLAESPPKTAELGLQITHLQPGNNWKVAAHCPDELVKKGVEGPLVIPPEPEDWREKKRTPLLTVWRRVYVERDQMADPVLNTGPGQSKFDGGVAAKTGANTVQLTLGGANTIVVSQSDQFQGGKIELLKADTTSLGIFDVAANTTGGTPTITIAQPVPADPAKFKDLIDDDINNISSHKVTVSADMVVDTSLWASRLEPALVVPVFDQPEVSAKNSNSVTFDIHIGDDNTDATERTDIKVTVKANKGSKSESGFWVVYQLDAFQGRMDEDKDPNPSTGTSGVSSVFSQPADDSEAGTILYAEGIREISENSGPSIKISVPNHKKAASIHEIGHEFGMTDGPTHGPLMNGADIFVADTQAKVDALIFNGKGLRKIMLTKQPGHDPQ